MLSVLQGLTSNRGFRLNGAVVLLTDECAGGKVLVETEDEEVFLIKQDRVREAREAWLKRLDLAGLRLSHTAPVSGVLMKIEGLMSEAGQKLNGSVVLVHDKPHKGRIEVETEEGRVLRVAQERLCPVRKEWRSRIVISAGTNSDPHQPAEQRIILLGATGAGKTAFLNLLCNMDKVNDLGDAGNQLDTFSSINDVTLEDPVHKMQSQTRDATVYRITCGGAPVDVVDTPGLGDTRGIETDREHLQRIVHTIEEMGSLHCICLVINGRSPRLTFDLQYALQQIVSIMPASVIHNIRAVFTNVSDILELTFDVKILNEILKTPVDDYIHVENPWCKLEKAKEKVAQIPLVRIKESLSKSFKEAKVSINKLFADIKSMDVVHTIAFQKLYQAKQRVEVCNFNLLSQIRVCGQLEERAALLDRNLAKAAEEALHVASFMQETLSRELGRTRSQNVVCGHPDCLEKWRKAINEGWPESRVDAIGNCHVACSCQIPRMDGTIHLTHCRAFRKSNSRASLCQVCGHGHQYHLRTMSKWSSYRRPWSSELQDRYANAATKQEQLRILHDECVRELEEHRNKRQSQAKELIMNVVEFQTLGLSRNYRKFLFAQMAMLKQHMDSLQEVVGGYIAREQLQEVHAHVQAIIETFDTAQQDAFKDAAFRKKWAAAILMVAEHADLATVKKAYRTKAKQFHPDKRGGEEEMFKNLRRAAEYLGYVE